MVVDGEGGVDDVPEEMAAGRVEVKGWRIGTTDKPNVIGRRLD